MSSKTRLAAAAAAVVAAWSVAVVRTGGMTRPSVLCPVEDCPVAAHPAAGRPAGAHPAARAGGAAAVHPAAIAPGAEVADPAAAFVRACLGGAAMREALRTILAGGPGRCEGAARARLQADLAGAVGDLFATYQAAKEAGGGPAASLLVAPGDIFFSLLPDLPALLGAGRVRLGIEAGGGGGRSAGFSFDRAGTELRVRVTTGSRILHLVVPEEAAAPELWQGLRTEVASLAAAATTAGREQAGNRERGGRR